MEVLFKVVLVFLVFLAVSSGITKIMLMQQDVEFFGAYGFTNFLLILYGATQLIGGILIAIPKTRVIGALIVAITFLVSAIVLIMAGNIPVAIVTIIMILLLGLIAKQSQKKRRSVFSEEQSEVDHT